MINKTIDYSHYYLHKTYDPKYYDRQYQNDLPISSKIEENSRVNRAFQISLPFLSLYQPFGKIISMGMGSIRVFTKGSTLFHANNFANCTLAIGQLTLATIALLGTLYHFTAGMYLTTVADISTNFFTAMKNGYLGEWKKASEEILQMGTSSLYLATMITGSLEVVLVSLLFQGLNSLYQAREEWSKGHIPEALAKSLMGMIRFYQAGGQMIRIERRNALLQQAQYRELLKRIEKGRSIEHLWNHPLAKQIGQKERDLILKDSQGNAYNFGSHAHGFGKRIVQGMNLTMRCEGEKQSLEFKIHPLFREQIESLVTILQKTSREDLKNLFSSGSNIEFLSLSTDLVDGPGNSYIGKEHAICVYGGGLGGGGKITIGASSEVLPLYNKVTIEWKKGENLYTLHELLSLLNLEEALAYSAKEDILRMQMGTLFHTFFPEKSIPFEQKRAYIDLPYEEFRQAIIDQSPEMELIFQNYLPSMELRPVLGGKMRYAVDGLAEQIAQCGGIGLTAALTGSWTVETAAARAASILKMGMLSSESRHLNQLATIGLSSSTDFYTGGASYVFTQMVTEENRDYDDFAYQGLVRFMISPKILEEGSYQYHNDNFGNRTSSLPWLLPYPKHPSILNFTQDQNRGFQSDNEVMISERIPPEYITAISVKNEMIKKELLQILRREELIQRDREGNETLFSKPIDAFIFVGNEINRSHFSRSSQSIEQD